MKFQIIILNITPLKFAFENNSNDDDIFNYLLSLPEIEIGRNCFKNCEKLKKFTVPASVTFIGDYAFYGCKILSDITIPSSVTSLHNHCFDGCVLLKNIQLPSSLESIGDFAFNNCNNLTKIDIPSSVKSIGDNFIDGCVNLESIMISSNVKSIGKLSLKNFTLLKEFIIPPCVTRIYEKEFDNCSSLEKIEIPPSVTHIEKYAFNYCIKLEQITIPPLVTSIEDGTFTHCISLKTLTIPDLVTSIGFYAFDECESLVKITFPPSVNKIGNTAFQSCMSLNKIDYENDLQNIEIVAELPENIKTAFLGDTNSGKTCFLNRLLYNTFNEEMIKTDTASFSSKEFEFQGKKINANIWDTSGDEKFKNMVKLYTKDKNSAAIFFDLNKPESFNKVEDYIKIIHDGSGQVPLVLIGNKCDLEHQVSIKDINELEKKYNAKYFEVSCKNDYNIREASESLFFEARYQDIRKKQNRMKNRIRDLIYNDEKKCKIY